MNKFILDDSIVDLKENIEKFDFCNDQQRQILIALLPILTKEQKIQIINIIKKTQKQKQLIDQKYEQHETVLYQNYFIYLEKIIPEMQKIIVKHREQHEKKTMINLDKNLEIDLSKF